MRLKCFVSALILFVALSLPVSAQTYDPTQFLGNYVSTASQDYVFVKRLAIEKQENGKIKFRATLSGFPDDLSLGEATGDPYSARTTDVYRNYLANFSTGKVSVFMTIATSVNSPQYVSVTSYLKYTDNSRPNVFFDGSLEKESPKPAK